MVGRPAFAAGLLYFSNLGNCRNAVSMQTFRNLLRDDRGVSAAEYALILAIIGGFIAFAAMSLGGAVANAMNEATQEIDSCGGGC